VGNALFDRITVWKADFFRLLGLSAIPELPYYFEFCPNCKKGPVRIAEDPLFITGWCGCENCGKGWAHLTFLSDYLQLPVDEVLKRYNGKWSANLGIYYCKQHIQQQVRLHKFYSHPKMFCYSTHSILTTHLHLPRITNNVWADRVNKYLTYSANMDQFRSIFLVGIDNCYRGPQLWDINTHDVHKLILTVKCSDLIGRTSGVFLWNIYDQIGHWMLSPGPVKPIKLADTLGFLFGDALWQAQKLPDIAVSTIFVLPPRDVIRLQIQQLQNSMYLLPAVATHNSQQRFPHIKLTKLSATYPYKRDWLWRAWPDKQFVFWVRTLDSYTRHCIRMSNGRYYVGDLPISLKDELPKATLEYIWQQSTQYKGEWDAEDFN
jgi:hypothetical protein